MKQIIQKERIEFSSNVYDSSPVTHLTRHSLQASLTNFYNCFDKGEEIQDSQSGLNSAVTFERLQEQQYLMIHRF